MKSNLAHAALFSALLTATTTPVLAEPEKFVVDDEHFSMAFEVMHIGYAPVIGMFRDIEGRFEFDEEANELSSGTLIFRSDSVFTNHDKRDEHLRKPDFLDSKKYPEVTFELTDFETTGENTGTVTGDLTMLGKTRPVDVDVTLNKSDKYPIGHKDYTLGISAEATIKRSDWGMTYGLDPELVGDEVKLRFGFEAIKDSSFF
ncbi:YceI family protein [Marinobacter goseongensis]|uniref:YceI family protein n=1 Tax=Marinobacter goseongensis TaxID=453838 RepID=UPI001AB6D479|nr:YceI family protein [Marinobacter goseongensis]MCK7549992.1 YceI family protein [Marinobacter goseongensis]